MKRVLDDLRLFCAVVEQGSLKAASDTVGVPHSTVSRRIEALEQNLGLTLLHRTTREVRVTPRGQTLYTDCAAMFDTISHAIANAVDAEVTFKGKLTVSMPVRAGIDFLGAWLIDFASSHPDLQLDIALSNSNQNLLQDDIDLAFRVGPLMDSSAIALYLWDIPYSLFAHKDFIQRHGLHSGEISIHQVQTLPSVVTRPMTQWFFVDEDNKEVQLSPQANLLVDDLGLANHAAKTGQYMVMTPTEMVTDPDMLPLVVTGLTARTRIMYAYYLGRRHAQSQIKQLIEYIRQRANSERQ